MPVVDRLLSWSTALAVLVQIFSTPPAFADPEEAEREITPAPSVAPVQTKDASVRPSPASIESIIQSLKADVANSANPGTDLIVVKPFELRRSTDTAHFEVLLRTIQAPNEAERLRRTLGVTGYDHLHKLATLVAKAGKGSDPWGQARSVIETYLVEEMEGLLAKRIVILWLQSEEPKFPSTAISGPIALQTVGSPLMAMPLNRVLERVEEYLNKTRPTSFEEFIYPSLQLITLSPFLPKLNESTQTVLLERTFQLGLANTDKSDLELIEILLSSSVPNLVTKERLNTVHGVMQSHAAVLRLWNKILEESSYCETAPGAVLTAASRMVQAADQFWNWATEKGSSMQKDFGARARKALVENLLALVESQPSLQRRLKEFPAVHDAIIPSRMEMDCATMIAASLEKLL